MSENHMEDAQYQQITRFFLKDMKNLSHFPLSKVREKIESLREIIRYHNRKYYIEDAPVISDRYYDQLFLLLKKWEERYPSLVTGDSPTQKIAVVIQDRFEKIRHLVPMLSLDNTYNEEDLIEFEKRVQNILKINDPIEYIVELKFDGIGIALVYENDVLTRGATRGDGIWGEDVTANIKTIKNIPLRVPFSEKGIRKIEIRGEIVMPQKSFLVVNEEREKEGMTSFANPRNAAAGSIRQLDTGETRKRDLTCFIYHISFLEGTSALHTQEESLQLLQSLGIPTSNDYRKCGNMREVLSYITEVEKKRDSMPFEIDGLVIKVNSFSLQEKLGYTAHHPRWAVAYKFSARQAETILNDIVFQVGRTGVVTPVAELKPVEIGGVTVKRATLHNKDYIQGLGIKVGDRVIVERAGDVIPQVVRAVEEKRTGREKRFIMISHCPVCKTPLVRLSNEVAYRCPNLSCPAQIEEGIIHFVSKDCMNIQGLGKKIVPLLIEHQKISTFADLYSLTFKDFIGLAHFKEKSITNLLRAIEASKNSELWRVIHALGIRHVGKKTSKTLADHFHSLPKLMNADYATLDHLADVGPIVAESIRAYMSTRRNRDLIEQMQKAGITMISSRAESQRSKPLHNEIFVFTGEMKRLTRDQAEQEVEKLGAHTSSAVTTKTTCVVVGEHPGSKLDKAKKWGIPVMREDEFLSYLKRFRKGVPAMKKEQHREPPRLF